MRHHRAAQPQETPQEVCPPPLPDRFEQFSPLNSDLVADPLFKSLSAKPPADSSNQLARGFGCVEISAGKAKLERQSNLPNIPTIEQMVTQSRNLNRIATGNPKAADFQIDEVSEHQFKRNYVEELLRLKCKIAPDLPDSELARFTKNVYKVEDPNGTYDTEAGTPQKLADSEQPQQNREQRRNLPRPASSGVGYCQIITPTALRLMTSDQGAVAASLRAEAAKWDECDSDTAEKLEKKAQLYSTVQEKVRSEILKFGEHGHKKEYFDDNGNPTEALYKDFSRSRTRTALGFSGKELATAMQGLLMDGNIGPRVQAAQLAEDLRDAGGPAAQEYFKNAAQGWQKASDKWEALSPDEKKRLITSYISKLDANKLSEEQRELLETRATGLAVCRSKDLPTAAEPNICDAILKAPADRRNVEAVPDVLKGIYCSAESLLNRARPALGQMFNNWGSETGRKMLDQHGASTKSLISPEALRANGIARGVNSDGLIERITKIQSRPDDFGSRDFESIFRDMSGVNYYNTKQK